jgi:hypothetical protein
VQPSQRRYWRWFDLKLQFSKKIAIVLAMMTLAIIAISALTVLWVLPENDEKIPDAEVQDNKTDPIFSEVEAGKYTKIINRTYSTDNELHALLAAENEINYMEIYGGGRFYNDFCANYIDNETLKVYLDEINRLEENNEKHIASFNYTATSKFVTNASIELIESAVDYIQSSVYRIAAFESREKMAETNFFGSPFEMEYCAKVWSNGSFANWNSSFPVEFGACYLVNLYLEYCDYFGLTAGQFSYLENFVVLDMTLKPIFIYVRAAHYAA